MKRYHIKHKVVVFRIKDLLSRMFVVKDINPDNFEYEIIPDFVKRELKLKFYYKPRKEEIVNGNEN